MGQKRDRPNRKGNSKLRFEHFSEHRRCHYSTQPPTADRGAPQRPRQNGQSAGRRGKSFDSHRQTRRAGHHPHDREGRRSTPGRLSAGPEGFAEADPDLDVSGKDTAQKLSILSSIVFNQYISPKEIYCEGITKITNVDIDSAHNLGYVIKLLAIAKRRGKKLELRVHPTLISKEHPLAKILYETNAIYLEGDFFKEELYTGKGAGQDPTASAVVYDILTNQLGIPAISIDINSFNAAALYYSNEGLGVNLAITSQKKGGELVKYVMQFVNSLCYKDQVTSLYKIEVFDKIAVLE